MAKLDVVQIPALSDNYIYLAHDADTGATAVVDPSEAAPVIAVLEEKGWSLSHILNTHHHMDHIGGNAELKAKYNATLVGPKADSHRISDMDVTLSEGDTYDFAGHVAQVFETPGHTSGHITLWFAEDKALFCGDTLFVLGCGRVFEGTMDQMWESLDKLRALPDDAVVYCAHEYTQANAKFALSVDGGNAALKERAARFDALGRRQADRALASGRRAGDEPVPAGRRSGTGGRRRQGRCVSVGSVRRSPPLERQLLSRERLIPSEENR